MGEWDDEWDDEWVGGQVCGQVFFLLKKMKNTFSCLSILLAIGMENTYSSIVPPLREAV